MATTIITLVIKLLPLILPLILEYLQNRKNRIIKRDLDDLGKGLIEEDADEIARFLEGIGV